MIRAIAYPKTNEDPADVLLGLQPRRGQKMLAIGGGGDQGFALATSAEVHMIDSCPAQIDVIHIRKDALYDGRTEEFLQQDSYDPTDVYRASFWREPGRMDRLRNRLSQVHVSQMNLDDALKFACEEGKTFDGIYLSNVLGYDTHQTGQDIYRQLCMVAHCLPKGGRAYVANHGQLVRRAETLRNMPSFLPSSMRIERGFSPRNKGAIRWDPVVYVKQQ
ncbi:MAG: hypothetical protein ACOCWQ_04225 [Nanoarchaeota archaeon]